MTEPFTQLTSPAAPMLLDNIDTDQIIPSREMKSVGKSGLADGLFAGWRYIGSSGREPDPDFILNRPAFQKAAILIGGRNFGCGSSREHAVWALAEFGVRAIIAPSFGAIFQGNCARNGVLAVELGERDVQQLAAYASDGSAVHIDLAAQSVRAGEHVWRFEIAPFDKTMLAEGLDPIALTLKQLDAIEAWEQRDRDRRAWLHAPPTRLA